MDIVNHSGQPPAFVPSQLRGPTLPGGASPAPKTHGLVIRIHGDINGQQFRDRLMRI
jgi:hypothetical protein